MNNPVDDQKPAEVSDKPGSGEPVSRKLLLTKDHRGMRIDYSGMLRQAREAIPAHNGGGAHRYMLMILQGHLKDLGERWYAGDTAVVDEFLQLYCIEKDAREALQAKPEPMAPVGSRVTWPKARDVGRLDDMHPNAHLRVGFDNDNDVCVSVWDGDGGATVEFCTPGSGGGRSPRTREALIALMVAMEAENAERPDLDWWALRRKGA